MILPVYHDLKERKKGFSFSNYFYWSNEILEYQVCHLARSHQSHHPKYFLCSQNSQIPKSISWLTGKFVLIWMHFPWWLKYSTEIQWFWNIWKFCVNFWTRRRLYKDNWYDWYRCFTLQAAGGGRTSQQIIEDLAGDILSKIPPNFNLEEVKVKLRYLCWFLHDWWNIYLHATDRLTGVLNFVCLQAKEGHIFQKICFGGHIHLICLYFLCI